MLEENLMEQKKPEAIVDDSLKKILRQVVRKLVMQGSETDIEYLEKDLTQQSNEKAENVL
jgi:hypothetical protein